jgi:hypothetical protein
MNTYQKRNRKSIRLLVPKIDELKCQLAQSTARERYLRALCDQRGETIMTMSESLRVMAARLRAAEGRGA